MLPLACLRCMMQHGFPCAYVVVSFTWKVWSNA
jgi:hypothetical protein